MNPRTRSWNAAMAPTVQDMDITIPESHVDGTIPLSLRGGRVLSNGPGWTSIGGRTAHPFDGHGYVRSFELLPGGGCRLRAAFVKTDSYREEEAAGRLVRRGLATNISSRFWENIRRGPVRNVANTTIVRWGDRLLAGWEGGAPHALDPQTLETHGEDDLGGAIAGAATLAHMRQDRQRGRMILCSVALGRDTGFVFREIDQDDEVVSTSEAKLDGMVFAHDYAITPSWFVVGGNPLQLKPWQLARSMVGAGTLLQSIKPDERRGGVLHLIPRGRKGPVRTITLPGPAFVVHFGNAFERDGDIVVDVSAFSRFDFGEEFGYSGPDSPFDPALPDARGPQKLYRVTIPADSDTAQWVPLTDHGVDFPRFHPDHEGRETPRLFGATRKDVRFSDPFDSIIGIDLRDLERPQQLWTAPENLFVGEPLFAPDAEHDDQGNIFAIVSDGLAAESTLVVFDAVALEKGPIASVKLPLLPVAFHGDWQAAR
ncbi:MAG: all-trans-8'-apo-beta-carotenal 15,15'-oxygenase [Myxococcota bacterium]|jgi:all-trans-8'-apo-beta-carotenal 15,15'-oxygenase